MTDSEPLPRTIGRVLVVEDSGSSRRLLQEILVRLGIDLPSLRVAGSITEAMVLFSQWHPQLAIVDLELRGDPSIATPPSPQDPKDGAELASHFLARNPAIRVIVCSAADASEAHERMRRQLEPAVQ